MARTMQSLYYLSVQFFACSQFFDIVFGALPEQHILYGYLRKFLNQSSYQFIQMKKLNQKCYSISFLFVVLASTSSKLYKKSDDFFVFLQNTIFRFYLVCVVVIFSPSVGKTLYKYFTYDSMPLESWELPFYL